MISSTIKDSNKKILSVNRDAERQVKNISSIEKKIEQLVKDRDVEISKLVSILTNTK